MSDIFTCCHTETKRGDHDFCLSRSHYTDTDADPTTRERGSKSRPPGQESRALPTELATKKGKRERERERERERARERERERERATDRQTDRERDRQTDRQTDSQRIVT